MPALEIFSLTPILCMAFAVNSGISKYRKGLPTYLKVLVAFLFLMLVTEIAGNIIRARGINNQWLYNGLLIVMHLALPYVYYHLLFRESLKRVIRVYFIVFPIFQVINTLYWQPFNQFQTNQVVFGGSFIFLLAAAYFWQLYASDDIQKITLDTGFWFSTGILLYYGVHVPMLGMLNYLWIHFPTFLTKYFVPVTTIFSIILNLCFGMGFLCRKAEQK